MTAARKRLVAVNTPTPSVIDVTPTLAAMWLEANTVNRSLRGAAVNQYAADMAAGRWSISDSALCFSSDGRLLNGQHRLNAVIEAGVTVPMLVMDNVPVDAMSNMDAGRKRSAADDLGFHGETHTAALASAIKLAIFYTDGRLYRDRLVQVVSNGEIREFLAENPDIRESVMVVTSSYKTVDCTPTVKAVSHWIFTKAASGDAADEFFDLLVSRIGLPAGSPILALDSRLRELRRNRTRLTQREELTLIVKAWNYWRTGRTVRSIAARTASDARVPTVSG